MCCGTRKEKSRTFYLKKYTFNHAKNKYQNKRIIQRGTKTNNIEIYKFKTQGDLSTWLNIYKY